MEMQCGSRMEKHGGRLIGRPLTTNLVGHSFWMRWWWVVQLFRRGCMLWVLLLCFCFSLDLSQAEAEDLSVACGASFRIEPTRCCLDGRTFVLRTACVGLFVSSF
jgi:hypothetical protein